MNKYVYLVSTHIKLMRPKQWLKNILLLFPPFFAGKIGDPSVLKGLIAPLVSFSLAASCCYIINDIKDREADRNHGSKKDRAIAKGDVTIIHASIFAAMLYIAALFFASSVSEKFEGFIVIYLFVSFIYTFFLKHVVLIDVFVISIGFLIRLLAGGEAFNTVISSWLFLTVFIVSLLLATGKRMAELATLGADAHKHRPALTAYTPSFLEGMLWFSAAAALVTYALYAIEHAHGLLYTVPMVAFGLLRYIYLAKQGEGEPTDILLKDGQIMGVGILWVLTIGVIIY